MPTIAPRTPPLTITDTVDRWTVTDASELYEVPRWGKGYFSVNANGHLQVHPNKDPSLAIDMKDLIERLQLRGLDLPILLRFNGILKDRLR
jgi:arginine decarboxylase